MITLLRFSDWQILKKSMIVTLIMLILLGAESNVHAKVEKLKFDHVFDLGSPGSQTFFQDNEGFLWIGTEGGGIFKYDGYELKNYGTGSGQLSNGHVYRILQDPEDPAIFWVTTMDGLNRFDKESETFTYYKHDPDNPESLGNNAVNDMVQDGKNSDILWIGTEKGLNKFSKNTGTFIRYEPDPKDSNSVSHNTVWRVVEDKEDPDILWLGTWGGGLDKFRKDTETFTHYTHHPNDSKSLGAEDNIVAAITQDKDYPGIIWIGTNKNGLDKFNKNTEVFTHYVHVSGRLDNIPNKVMLIYDDGYGTLWLGGWDRNYGLVLFDKHTETFVNYKNSPDDPHSLSNDLVADVFEDR